MSVLGTGMAAQVAQSGLQAQQIGRQQAKRESDSARDSERLREVFETVNKGLEEDDAAEDSTRPHVSGDLGEREHPDDAEQHARQHQSNDEDESEASGEAADVTVMETEPAREGATGYRNTAVSRDRPTKHGKLDVRG